MPRYIVKLGEQYMMWSTIVDAPISEGMTLEQLTEWTRSRQGTDGVEELQGRLERVHAKGTSAFSDNSAEDTIWLNRAGPNESTLTIEGVYRHYCLGEEIQDSWIVPRELASNDSYDLHAHVIGDWPKFLGESV